MGSLHQTNSYEQKASFSDETQMTAASLQALDKGLLLSVLQDVPVGIMLCNHQSTVLAGNTEASRLLDIVDLTGSHLLDLFKNVEYLDDTDFTPQSCPVQLAITHRRRIANVLLERQRPRAEESHRLLLSATPKFSADGAVAFVLCSLQDISHFDPIRDSGVTLFVQNAIVQAKKEWTNTVDALPDLIFLESLDGRLLRCNKAAAEFFQLSYQEILSKKLADLFFGSAATADFDDPFRIGNLELQIPGREGWYEASNYKIERDQGRAVGWVHIVRDITTRRRTAARLRQLNTVLEQTAEAILIADSTGIIQYVNPAYETITGWNREEATGRHFLTLGGQTSKLTHYKEAIEELSNGRSWHNIDLARRKDGTPYNAETTISPVRDGNGNLLNYIAVSRDITEKKRLESLAEEINMMENVGYIFSGIRHEMGNPINSVKTALSVLILNIDRWPQTQVVNYLNRMQSEVTRMEYLLQVLKSFSLYENPDIRNLNVISFLKSFLSLVENDFSKRGIKVSASLDSEFDECEADPRALHQVILNLFSNAAEALVNRDNPTIRLSLGRVGHMVQIKITDNGTGMDETQLGNLFKPFYTTKASGTGMGLVIVKKLMIMMNGMINVRSKPQVGTEVSLLLEAAKAK